MVQGFLRIAIFLGISSQCDLVETKRASYVTKKLRFEIHDASFIHNSKVHGSPCKCEGRPCSYSASLKETQAVSLISISLYFGFPDRGLGTRPLQMCLDGSMEVQHSGSASMPWKIKQREINTFQNKIANFF